MVARDAVASAQVKTMWLDAAEDLWWRRGEAGLSVRLVIKHGQGMFPGRFGTSAKLYHHWAESKFDGLLDDMYQRLAGRTHLTVVEVGTHSSVERWAVWLWSELVERPAMLKLVRDGVGPNNRDSEAVQVAAIRARLADRFGSQERVEMFLGLVDGEIGGRITPDGRVRAFMVSEVLGLEVTL